MAPETVQFEVKLGFPLFEAPLRSMEQWAEVMGFSQEEPENINR